MPPVNNEYVRWGKLLEPVVMAEYAIRSGHTLLPRKFHIHPKYEFIGGNIDAAIKGDEVGVEVKTAFSAENWGPNGSDEIPLYYLCQVHHYMMITGWKKWIVVALIGGSMFRTYYIEKDPEAEAMLLEEEIEFWNNNVQRRIPPRVEGYSKAYANYLMGRVTKNAVCTTNDMMLDETLQDMFGVALQKDRAEEKYDRMKMKVIEAMARVGADKIYNESGFINWGMRRGKTMTDWPAIIKEAQIDPKLIEKHTSRGESGDYFRVTHRLVEKSEFGQQDD
jgi:predicted phage-related endonuclease